MKRKQRTLLDDAIQELRDTAQECPNCHRLFVYGQKDTIFCSTKCARATSQRRYMRRKKNLRYNEELGHTLNLLYLKRKYEPSLK